MTEGSRSGLSRPTGRAVNSRLVEAVTETALVMVASELANSDKQMHELRELLEANCGVFSTS